MRKNLGETTARWPPKVAGFFTQLSPLPPAFATPRGKGSGALTSLRWAVRALPSILSVFWNQQQSVWRTIRIGRVDGDRPPVVDCSHVVSERRRFGGN